MYIKRSPSEKSLTARRSNARKSRGPTTDLGRQRRRDASLRHGLYSQDDDKVLRALGEDPRELAQITTAVREKFPFDTGFDQELGMCLVKAMWRFRRADRGLDALAVRKALDAGRWRENRLHAQSIHLKATADSLRNLLKSVSDPDYLTSREDFDLMDNLRYEEAMVQIGDLMLALFCELFSAAESDDRTACLSTLDWPVQRTLNRIRSAFGLERERLEELVDAALAREEIEHEALAAEEVDDEAAMTEDPQILEPAVNEDEAATDDAEPMEFVAAPRPGRERLRQLLENLLRRQAEVIERYHLEMLHEALDGPSPCERAAEAVPISDSAHVMQRMTDSSFRMIWRTTNLLLKLRKQMPDPDSGGTPPVGHEPNPGHPSAPLRQTPANGVEAHRRVADRETSRPAPDVAAEENALPLSSVSEAAGRRMVKMKVYPGKLNPLNKSFPKRDAESERAMANSPRCIGVLAMQEHGQDARGTNSGRRRTDMAA